LKKSKKSLGKFKNPLDKHMFPLYNDFESLENQTDTTGGDIMKYNYSKLLGRMKEFKVTQAKLAEIIDRDNSTVSSRLNNKSVFTIAEIDKICKALDIAKEDIGNYFFAE
jgi:plasmid maintenance system antidote protein VapI